jgi:hypothetical protein
MSWCLVGSEMCIRDRGAGFENGRYFGYCIDCHTARRGLSFFDVRQKPAECGLFCFLFDWRAMLLSSKMNFSTK